MKLALGLEPDFSPRWEKPLALRFLAGVNIPDPSEKYAQWKDYIVDLHNTADQTKEKAVKVTSGADVLRGGILTTTGRTVDEALEISNKILTP